MCEKNKTFGFQWHLTNLCNGRCDHCYQESFTSDNALGLEVQKATADEIFDTLSHRPVTVNITGGEPLLLGHLPDLLSHLGTKPNLDELWIITNGTVAGKKMLHSLRRIDALTGIKVSLEAADQAINDSIRWPGHLAALSRNMDSFVSLEKQVVAMVTLSNRNVHQIDPLVKWAKDMGCSGVMFERFVPVGHGLQMKEQVLDSDGWTEACRLIGMQAGQVLDQEDASIYKAFWISFGQDEDLLRGAFCNLGDESMALMPDGAVFPCRRLPMEVGRMPDEDFGEIIERLESFSAGKIRARLKGRVCKTCRVDQCAGCRALALALTGDYLADDPLCPGPVMNADPMIYR